MVIVIFRPNLACILTCIVLRSAHMFWTFHFFRRKYLTLKVNPMNFVLLLVLCFMGESLIITAVQRHLIIILSKKSLLAF